MYSAFIPYTYTLYTPEYLHACTKQFIPPLQILLYNVRQLSVRSRFYLTKAPRMVPKRRIKTIACAGECCWNYLTKRENDAQRLSS